MADEPNTVPTKLSVTHVQVGVNMGDHAQDVTNAITITPDTTVLELAGLLTERDWRGEGHPRKPRFDDYVVIRLERPFVPVESLTIAGPNDLLADFGDL